MKDVSILIFSVDAYCDCWEPFYRCFKKYWSNCPYPIYLSGETKTFDKIQTICTGKNIFTTRQKMILEQLKTEFVIILCIDYFICEQVDQEKIEYCIKNFNSDVTTFNFQPENWMYGPTMITDLDGFRLRLSGTPYLHSAQPGIWNREKLIQQLSTPQNPWEWELTTIYTNEKYYINSSKKNIINYVHGLTKGKWNSEVYEFFLREGIKVDFDVRGFVQ